MSPKKKRSVPKGTGRRYTSARPEQPAAPARRRPPPPGDAEGPSFSGEVIPAVFANAEFAIKGDRRAVEKALEKALEFLYTGEETEGEFAGSAHYSWLSPGRSSIPQIQDDQAPPDGLEQEGAWVAGPRESAGDPLGDLFVSWDAVSLQCLSRQHLEAGKELLYQILGTRIQHVQDQFQELSAPWAGWEDAGGEFDQELGL